MSGAIVRAIPVGGLNVEKARDLLARATRVDEVKHVRDVAVAMKAYARAVKAGKAAQLDAAEIIVRADRRLGEIDAQAVHKSGGKGGTVRRPDDAQDRQRAHENRRIATLAETDLDAYTRAARRSETPVTVAGAVALARLEAPERKAVLAKLGDAPDMRRAIGEVRRSARITRIETIARGNAPLGSVAERFPVIYADPPWRYEHGPGVAGAAEGHYPTMAIEEICSLPVGDVATPDSMLFLWATSPKLAEAMRAIEAWGFTYRTSAVWIKDRAALGHYFRQRHELLLVAARGTVITPAPKDRRDSVFEVPRGKHSEKPAAVAEWIESAYPTLPRIELFARSSRPGWAAWGNQAGARGAA